MSGAGTPFAYAYGADGVRFAGSLSFDSLFNAIPLQEGVPSVVSVTVQAAQVEGTPCPALLCIVQDRSGSMGVYPSNRLERCTSTLDILLEQDKPRLEALLGRELTTADEKVFPVLKDPRDAIAVVGFDCEAKVVVPCTRMDDSGIIKARCAMVEMKADGGTNIRRGLEMGLDLVDRHGAAEGRFSILLMLTDGQDSNDFGSVLKADGSKLSCVQRLQTMGKGAFVSACISDEADCALMDTLCQYAQGLQIFVNERKDKEGIAKIAGGVGDFILGCVREEVELRLYRVLTPKALLVGGDDGGEGQAKRQKVADSGARLLLEAKRVLLRNGEPLSMHFTLPACPEGEEEMALEVELRFNGEVVSTQKKVLKRAAPGAADPAVNVVCVIPACRAVRASAMRGYAVALGSAKPVDERKAEAVQCIQKGLQTLSALQAMCLPVKGGTEPDEEGDDFVLMDRNGEEDGTLLEARREFATAFEELSQAEKAALAVTRAAGFDMLRGNAYRSSNDSARCNTIDADAPSARESSRSLSAVVAGMARARVDSAASSI